jgi:DNA-binding transcriptional MocR family regulator
VAEFRRACDTVLRRHGSRVFQAGASDGLAELRDWLSGWLGKQGVPAAAEEITITNGCQQSLDLLAKAMVDSGQAVAVENPIYPGALLPFRQAGARVVPVPAGREGVDLEALEAISERQRIRLLLVTPNFQNPTSATMPDAARRRLVEIARRRQVAIVENDSYGLLRYEGHPQTPLKALAPDEVIYLGSFSKVGFPGLRLGWCAAPAALSARLRRAKQATDLHTDHFVQAVMLEFAERGGLARAVRAVREACRRNAATLVQEAAPRMPEGVRWERPRGGISAWFTLPQEVDAEAVLARARGVVFTPGRFFYFHEPQANTLRLSFGNLTPRAIARGVAVLADAIRAEMRQRARAPRRATPGVRLALV